MKPECDPANEKSNRFKLASQRNKASRTLAVIPKSIIQTSPGLTTGIVILHTIEHHRSIQRRPIAQFNVLVLGRKFN
jgi:hypothetical protein